VALAAARLEIRALQTQLAKRNWQALVAQLLLAERKRVRNVKDPAEPPAEEECRSDPDSAYEGSTWASGEQRLALREARLRLEMGDQTEEEEELSQMAGLDAAVDLDEALDRVVVNCEAVHDERADAATANAPEMTWGSSISKYNGYARLALGRAFVEAWPQAGGRDCIRDKTFYRDLAARASKHWLRTQPIIPLEMAHAWCDGAVKKLGQLTALRKQAISDEWEAAVEYGEPPDMDVLARLAGGKFGSAVAPWLVKEYWAKLHTKEVEKEEDDEEEEELSVRTAAEIQQQQLQHADPHPAVVIQEALLSSVTVIQPTAPENDPVEPLAKDEVTMDLRVCTWNLKHFTTSGNTQSPLWAGEYGRLSLVSATLSDLKPDVLVVQEVKNGPGGGSAVQQLAARLSMECTWSAPVGQGTSGMGSELYGVLWKANALGCQPPEMMYLIDVHGYLQKAAIHMGCTQVRRCQ